MSLRQRLVFRTVRNCTRQYDAARLERTVDYFWCGSFSEDGGISLTRLRAVANRFKRVWIGVGQWSYGD
jgi:hypothetical protein